MNMEERPDQAALDSWTEANIDIDAKDKADETQRRVREAFWVSQNKETLHKQGKQPFGWREVMKTYNFTFGQGDPSPEEIADMEYKYYSTEKWRTNKDYGDHLMVLHG